MMERYDLEDTNKYGYEPHMSMVESIDGDYILFTDHEEAIKQAVAVERDACAKIANETYSQFENSCYTYGQAVCDVKASIVKAIRQRGEK